MPVVGVSAFAATRKDKVLKRQEIEEHGAHRQHLRARVAVGTGSPSFAANGQVIFFWASVSLAVK